MAAIEVLKLYLILYNFLQVLLFTFNYQTNMCVNADMFFCNMFRPEIWLDLCDD